MTKSIEEQATEYTKKRKITNTEDGLERTLSERAYIDAAKSRDAQWLKVVNELRDCTQDIIKNKMVHPFEYHHYSREDMVELLKSALTKADQLMKEMGVEL